jgi:hypothetical protein
MFMKIMGLKATRRIGRATWYGGAAAGVLLLAVAEQCRGADSEVTTNAPSADAQIKVKGTQGRVQFSRKDGPFVPAAEATVLRAGDVIRTATGSAAELDFGPGPGTVRVTEGTIVAIEKLVLPKQPGAAFAVELTLRSGELLGSFKESGAESRFEVKTASGIARPLRGQFRVQARGFLVVLEGKAIFAYVPVGGEPAVHTLTAPPACYFTPSVGVQPAPRNLVREVNTQMKAKLRRDY